MYGGGSSIIGNAYDVPTMAGFATPWLEQTDDAIGLAFSGDGAGIALIRAKVTGELRYSIWTGSWSPGFGAAMLPVQVGLLIAGGPSLAGSSLRGHAAYQGVDMKFYYAEEMGAFWSPTNEPIKNGAVQASGPAPPTITTLSDNPVIAFIGNDGDLYDQARMGGVWQPASAHGIAGQAAGITPAIVALTQGPELLIVYTDAAAHDLKFTTRSLGVWSAPAVIAGASSDDPVSLAPLEAGGAVLSYRGKGGHLHTSLLSANAPPTWSAPISGVMGADPTIVSPPAVAKGAIGAEAELYYLDTNVFTVYSARMTNGAWGAASFAGTASARLAIATGK